MKSVDPSKISEIGAEIAEIRDLIQDLWAPNR